MRAIVMEKAGSPDVLKLVDYPVPRLEADEVLVEVKAFGLNYSEIYGRRGKLSLDFPRIPGTECVGTVKESPGGEFRPGEIVATAAGDLGKGHYGSYAEFVSVNVTQVMKLKTNLDWVILGSLPEMIQTSWGALHNSLQIQPGQTLLIRNCTSSVGMAALVLAKLHKMMVIATTKSPENDGLLREYGADYVFIDTGDIATELLEVFPGGINSVLELSAADTLRDSLRCAAGIHSTVCIVRAIGEGTWKIGNFDPFRDIPPTVKLTCYDGTARSFVRTPLQEIIGYIEKGLVNFLIDRVFKFDEIVEAHRYMEGKKPAGKIVIQL